MIVATMWMSACETRQEPKGAPACVIARVGGSDEVTTHDADVLRALLSPPPTVEEAKRFAVVVAAAYRAEHAMTPRPDVGKQLEVYRDAMKRRGPDLQLASIEPGVCWAGDITTADPKKAKI